MAKKKKKKKNTKGRGASRGGRGRGRGGATPRDTFSDAAAVSPSQTDLADLEPEPAARPAASSDDDETGGRHEQLSSPEGADAAIAAAIAASEAREARAERQAQARRADPFGPGRFLPPEQEEVDEATSALLQLRRADVRRRQTSHDPLSELSELSELATAVLGAAKAAKLSRSELIPTLVGTFTAAAACAERSKTSGNAAFKAGDLLQASGHYREGVLQLRKEIFGGGDPLQRHSTRPGRTSTVSPTLVPLVEKRCLECCASAN